MSAFHDPRAGECRVVSHILLESQNTSLATQVKEYREALERIANCQYDDPGSGRPDRYPHNIARTALDSLPHREGE